MLYTDNYDLNLPEKNEQFNIEHFNDNSRAIDEQLKINSDDINTVNERLLDEIKDRESVNDTLQSDIDTKLNKNQSSSNKGKIMEVSDNGELKPSGLYHKTYITIAELGLTSSATIQNVMDKLAFGESCIIRTDSFSDLTQFNNIRFGYLQITKTVKGLCKIQLNDVIAGDLLYYGRQAGGKFQNWEKLLVDLKDKKTLIANTATLKLDVTKKNSAWYGAIKLTHLYDTSPVEVEIDFKSATDTLKWTVVNGQKYIKKVTYTQDSANKAHYTIGIEFSGTTYGCYQAEVVGGFADINSLTADAFTGDTTAVYGNVWGKNNGVTLVTSPEDLGLTSPCTTVQLVQAMRNTVNNIILSGAIGVFNNSGYSITDVPSNYGLLHIEFISYDRTMIRYDGVNGSNYNGSWIGQIEGNNGTFSGISWVLINPERLDKLKINSTKDVGLSTFETDPFTIGKSNGVNLALDNNEIQARNNGEASTLNLNFLGGDISLGNENSLISIPGRLESQTTYSYQKNYQYCRIELDFHNLNQLGFIKFSIWYGGCTDVAIFFNFVDRKCEYYVDGKQQNIRNIRYLFGFEDESNYDNNHVTIYIALVEKNYGCTYITYPSTILKWFTAEFADTPYAPSESTVANQLV